MKGERKKSGVASVYITDAQRQKWHELAKELGVSPNAVIGMLIDNARIKPVQKLEVVSILRVESSSV